MDIQVILDIETNKLIDPDKLWIIVCKDIETQEVREFIRPDLHPEAFLDYVKDCTSFIGHNIIGFDHTQINRLVPGASIRPDRCIDTLVVSRLLNYSLAGGHSLEAWGERLGVKKVFFKDFDYYSEEMREYCIQDVQVTYELYRRFEKYVNSPRWKLPLEIEHATSLLCARMQQNGFRFNTEVAGELATRLDEEIRTLDRSILDAFPAKRMLVDTISPRWTQSGMLFAADKRRLEAAGYNCSEIVTDRSYEIFEDRPFNPGSPSQIVERLNEAGWKPYEKTKSHIEAERTKDKERLAKFRVSGWKVNEANLATLPDTAPEGARSLARRIVLANRRSTLQGWLDAAAADTRVHGSYFHIGSWTHRMSHAEPNTANIPTREDAIYAHDMRRLWVATPGYRLVGVDADAIQLRILGHHMEDQSFIQSLINGDKSKGTDAHSLNKVALGDICKSRAKAKVFVYAWLLGAGYAKVASILDCSLAEAKQAVSNFLDFYPGLKYIKETRIPRDAERGYFEGVDGRYIHCDSKHLMLSGYLQSGETIVMKLAAKIWSKALKDQGLYDYVREVNFVHDEWQTEVLDRDDMPLIVAKIQAESIRQAGEILKLKCPMLGTYINADTGKPTIGDNWVETH